MWTVTRLGSAALALLSFTLQAGADMGAIVPVADVRLDEPGQKAIIGHDGFEEVLVLATDFRATDQTKVLRFIPLPAEPDVDLAPQDCFARLATVVGAHNLRYLVRYRGGQPKEGAPVEIRSQKRIGAHDVTVVRVKDATHFSTWANNFFKERGLPQRELTEEEAALVADYVSRGMPFFVFDLVELGPDTRSVAPLVYRFPTKHMYYPLKTSNLFGGEGRIDLFVFSDRGGLEPHGGDPYQGYRYPGEAHESRKRHRVPSFMDSTTAIITAKEMNTICPALGELLGARAVLHAFKYEGKLSFEDDIWFPVGVKEVGPYYPNWMRSRD
jgi:hypothetical protein